jgi:uncharacterized protein YdeI (YjbR/CyaY-like superfamily)
MPPRATSTASTSPGPAGSRARAAPDKAGIPDNAVHPSDRAGWRQWLERHHTRADGLWLVMDKKAAGRINLSYDDAVEEALCFGWIDSKTGMLDVTRTLLWMAPRQRKSGWSKPNKERVERMISAGLMHPSGLVKIEAAKANGTWSLLDAVEALEVPQDLRAAFARHPGAAANFEAFSRSVKRGILEWIVQAKKDATRAARIEQTASMAARNERANQWTGPKKGASGAAGA